MPAMPSGSVESGSVLPRACWRDLLRQTVVEVFSIMVGATVSEAASSSTDDNSELTGMVGIGGAMRANLIVRCNHDASTKLASQMLGIAPEDPDSGKAAYDARGEFCNIVAGFFKAKVGLGDACMLSVPTIVTGRDYRLHSARNYERLELPVAYENETLRVTLEIAQ